MSMPADVISANIVKSRVINRVIAQRFMSPPAIVAGGTMFSGCPSVRLSVRASVSSPLYLLNEWRFLMKLVTINH